MLRPLLFIIFMNDLPLYVNSNFDMYADDSILHTAAKTLDENNVTNVHSWYTNNKLVVNVPNTKKSDVSNK